MGFENIIGYKVEKEALQQAGKMLRSAEEYRNAGVRIPRGVLLCGAPGVGKTAMVRAMAGDGIALVELRAADCCGNAMEEAVHEAFARAREQAPAILLMDELDKIAGCGGKFFMEENDSVRKLLLQELDALTPEDAVLVAATCNEPNLLGEAMIRPGRFDRMISIPLPDEKTRRDILRHYLGKVRLRKNCRAESIARMTEGFSSAELECLVNEAAIHAIEAGHRSICEADAVCAMNRQCFFGIESDHPGNAAGLRQVAVHEAGHAVVSMALRPDSVCDASILRQGETLGHVSIAGGSPEEISTDDVLDRVCVGLAGRAAEKMIYGKTFLGSGHDLEKAADAMMCLLTRHGIHGYKYLLLRQGYCGPEAPALGDELAQVLDTKMERQERRAEELLQNHRVIFNRIVERLMERKMLSSSELQELWKTETAPTEAA